MACLLLCPGGAEMHFAGTGETHAGANREGILSLHPSLETISGNCTQSPVPTLNRKFKLAQECSYIKSKVVYII